jgi:hypothetical protein
VLPDKRTVGRIAGAIGGIGGTEQA